MAEQPLAVVTGADHPTGLGSGRALRRAGARVIGVTALASGPALASRAWSEVHRLDPRADAIAQLAELGRRLDRPAFLLPTQDTLVAELSRRRHELEPWFRFQLPPDDIVQTFLEKTRFYEWAKPRGLPLPESRIVRDADALHEALRTLPYPLVLKPLYRSAEWDRLSPVHKAYRLEAAADLQRIPFDPLATVSALILSQWIEGPDSDVHFCLACCARPGELTASFTGRKLLQYPRQTGSTAICVATSNEELRALTETTFREAGFVGIGSLEVKYGPDRRPWITEPTVGRPNLQSYSAVAAGVNLHALTMAQALGMEWRAPRAPRGCFWMEESALLELATSRGGPPVPWTLLLREAFAARRVSGAWWSWRDPSPGGRLFARRLRGGVRRLLGRGGSAA